MTNEADLNACGLMAAGQAVGDYKVARMAVSAYIAAMPEVLTTSKPNQNFEVVNSLGELDALPVDSVVMEVANESFMGIQTMRGVFHRFPDGWYVVAGHVERTDIVLPATVLYTPKEQS